MTTIDVYSSDEIIWNKDSVLVALAKCNEDVIINLNDEGLCMASVGLDKILAQSSAKNILVKTANALEQSWPNIDYRPPIHVAINTSNNIKNKSFKLDKKQAEKKFGMFIGRSNYARLFLSSAVQNLDIIQTFHYDRLNNFHISNLGLEKFLTRYGEDYLDDVVRLIKKAPITLDKINKYPILFEQHLDIVEHYHNFVVEITCESYFTGTTFFPTEKVWRPIIMKTPFIVQGPQNFLNNLKKMGFKTFDRWWDEGYSEDPADQQCLEILKVIESLNKKSIGELLSMYDQMQEVLEHNYQTLNKISVDDFWRVRNEQ